MDLSSYLDQIRREIDNSSLKKYADEVYAKTGVAPEVIVVSGGALLSVMLFFGIFPELICDMVAYGFPFYGTLSTIETRTFKKNWYAFVLNVTTFVLCLHKLLFLLFQAYLLGSGGYDWYPGESCAHYSLLDSILLPP